MVAVAFNRIYSGLLIRERERERERGDTEREREKEKEKEKRTHSVPWERKFGLPFSFFGSISTRHRVSNEEEVTCSS